VKSVADGEITENGESVNTPRDNSLEPDLRNPINAAVKKEKAMMAHFTSRRVLVVDAESLSFLNGR